MPLNDVAMIGSGGQLVYGQVVAGSHTHPESDVTNLVADLAAAVGAPTGAVVMWTTGVAPTGWLLCDGSSQLRASFAALFAVIGTTYGSVDGTHFTLPNLKSRFPVGLDAADAGWDTLGETGGAKTHTHAGHSAHVVTQPGAHSAHVVTQPSAHVVTQPVAHVVTQAAAHTSVATKQGAAAGNVITVGTHAGAAVDAHSGTALSVHAGSAVDAHSAHAGAAVDAHSTHDTPTALVPYFALNFVIKA